MGLHPGESSKAEEGHVGTDIRRGGRLAHVGHVGQVLLLEATADLLKRGLLKGISLKELGEFPTREPTKRALRLCDRGRAAPSC